MNVPNQLTVSRFVLTAVFLAVYFSGMPYHRTIALVVFCIAGLTDYWDGKIARRDKIITNFGVLMDPLADKILICSAFIAFVDRVPRTPETPWMPAWMVIVVVARELSITGLRMLAASKNVVLAAERYGKHKTISQIVCIISILTLAAYRDWGFVGEAVFGLNLFGWGPWVEWFTEASKWMALALTVFSGMMYLWKNRGIYLSDL